MNGAIIAFDPCHACKSHDMCSRCELTLRRDGALRTDKWISVEERLPEFEHCQTIVDVPFPIPTPIKVLCAFQTKVGYIIREGTYEIHDGLPYFVVKGRVAGIVGITHWMPLPEAPKGGVE